MKRDMEMIKGNILAVQTVMQKGWPLVLGVCVVVVCVSKFFWKF